ncbi:MAG: PadR family transcriptional regulator [Myxococcota bacterium]
MSVEFTILGVLIESPSHGYSIKKQLARSYSEDFGLNDGQLYPALARLESRGWIQKTVVPQKSSPARHLYRPTATGRRAFRDWLRRAYPGGRPVRYDFLLRNEFLQKCSFLSQLEPDEVGMLGEQRLREVERRLSDLERVLETLEEGTVDPFRRMVVEFGIRYQRLWRDWLLDLMAHNEERVPRQDLDARPDKIQAVRSNHV